MIALLVPEMIQVPTSMIAQLGPKKIQELAAMIGRPWPLHKT